MAARTASEDEVVAPQAPRARARPPTFVLLAIGFLVLIVAICLFADVLAPTDYKLQALRSRLRPPVFLGGTTQHLLGTDELGRDLLSRLIYAIRFSMLVALGGTLIGAVVGTVTGFMAAHYRGAVEEGLMMLADVQASLPFMLIALACIAVFGGGFWLFVLLMGLYGWEVFARLTRGMVIAARSQGYVAAVVGMGARPRIVYWRHVLPNILAVLVVQFTLNFPQVILLETSLSFLGVGIRPPLTSLGQMLGAGRAYLTTAWWIALLPGTVIFLTTLSISLVGDWLRDRLDPTLKGQ